MFIFCPLGRELLGGAMKREQATIYRLTFRVRGHVKPKLGGWNSMETSDMCGRCVKVLELSSAASQNPLVGSWIITKGSRAQTSNPIGDASILSNNPTHNMTVLMIGKYFWIKQSLRCWKYTWIIGSREERSASIHYDWFEFWGEAKTP